MPGRFHEDQPHRGLPGRPAAPRGQLQLVGRQVGHRSSTARSCASRPTPGIIGYGEVCPLGPFYLPAYAAGVRAGIAELGPHLLGEDPRELGRLNQRMDAALKGHPYVKSGIDMACWDILGQAAGLPVCTLLGGRYGDDFVLYRAISQESPETMAGKVAGYRAEGYRRFQLKVGGDPDVDIARIRAVAGEARAGRPAGRRRQHRLAHARGRARRAGRPRRRRLHRAALPRATKSACRSAGTPTIRSCSTRSIDSLDMLLRGHADRAMDVVNLKISKFGGLTKARQARDLCVSLGIAMTIEDSWGGDIVTAAIAHLAHSTPPEFLFTATDFNSYVTVSTAEGAPRRRNGRMAASSAPGLGVTPNMDVLGRPKVDVS